MTSSYSIERAPSTVSSVLVVVGLLAAATVQAAPGGSQITRITPPILADFETGSSRKVAYELERDTVSFEEGMGRIYGRLQAAQEPLGADFERVLVDNLWDLYARS